MSNSQHVKVLNTDGSGKNRLRFASSRKVANQATADVYRSFKRRIGIVTSASAREEEVHHQITNKPSSKRRKAIKDNDSHEYGNISNADLRINLPDDVDDDVDTNQSIFSKELDITGDRNASEIFGELYKEVWHISRSLPEVLHHSETIVELLLAYMLSPESKPGTKSGTSDIDDVDIDEDENNDEISVSDMVVDGDIDDTESRKDDNHASSKEASGDDQTISRQSFIENQATTDILHLLSALARDLRHEIHPYVHTKIIPRIVSDLLNPPIPKHDSGKQQAPLDIAVVEASFRTLSYIFRYDSLLLTDEKSDNKNSKSESCLESMRQYYGMTLAHRRDLIRRLAAESFAGLIRKLPSDNAKKKHLRRVIKALVAVSTTATAGQQPPSSASLRLQHDAIDGISCLLFEIARGIPGQLHSKANTVVIKFILDFFQSENSKLQKNGLEIVYSLAVALMDRLCKHLNELSLGQIVSTIIRSAKDCLYELNKSSNIDEKLSDSSRVANLLKLINHINTADKGAALRAETRILSNLENLLEELMVRKVFQKLSNETREAAMDLFCTSGGNLVKEKDFIAALGSMARRIMTEKMIEYDDKKQLLQFSNTAAWSIINKLMINIPSELGMSTFGSSLVESASSIVTEQPFLALEIIYGMLSMSPKSATPVIVESDDVIFLEGAVACTVDDDCCAFLLNKFLDELDSRNISTDNIPIIAAFSQAASFMALVGGDDHQNKRMMSNYKRVTTVLLQLMTEVKTLDENVTENSNIHILMSMAIECYARMSVTVMENTKSSKLVHSKLAKLLPLVEDLILTHPASIWTMKSCAIFINALKLIDLKVTISSDIAFDRLVPNLYGSYHFLRLHTLTILANFPTLGFVVDHADLDLTDDLDEEVTTPSLQQTKTGGIISPGSCCIIETLLEIESTQIDIANERRLLHLISRIEVLGRTAKLPIVYAEAAAAHMIGILHIKYAPVWSSAIKALAGLAKGNEKSVWQSLQQQLAARMQRYLNEELSSAEEEANHLCSIGLERKFKLFEELERDGGKGSALFAKDVAECRNSGRVSRHLNADDSIILQSLWSTIETAPNLVTTYSRSIVPIFLRFMKDQYYVAFRDDPDALEMDLADFSDKEESNVLSISPKLNSRQVLNRLLSILKVFSTVNGPHQLYKHRLLLPIFVSLTGHQDADIAKLAVSCVLKFKPKYLLHVGDIIYDFFAKGKLQSGMMRFKTFFETGTLDPKDRMPLLIFLSRVLFGRLLARGTALKSSKDSPSSRRRAIVLFLSSICESETELYPFIFLMIRVYLPRHLPRKPIESQTPDERTQIIQSIMTLSLDDCKRIPLPVHQGFLNVLEALLTQIGHRVVEFVPTFMSIILSQCKAFEIKEITRDETITTEDEETEAEGKVLRTGVVRSLCYRRLVNIFVKFAEAIDLHQFSARLWGTLKNSIKILPEMVENSETVPSLLVLLTTMAKHRSLIKMLHENNNAVPSVLKCLSKSSKHATVEIILSFIEDLMAEDNNSQDGTGQFLIQTHIVLLLDQFRSRVSSVSFKKIGRSRARSGYANTGSSTLRRELRILCSLSTILDSDTRLVSREDEKVFESLCLLLVPFLDVTLNTSDDEKIVILGLIEKLCGRMSIESSRKLFDDMSGLFGPSRGKPGTSSKLVRKSMASVVQIVASRLGPCASQVSAILKDLCALNEKKVDELEYDKIIPALESLDYSANSSLWLKLCNEENGVMLLQPIILCLFHFLFVDDGVVSRGAFKGLKSVIKVSSVNSTFLLTETEIASTRNDYLNWRKLLEGCVVPTARAGLNSNNSQARRFHILLIGDIANCCRNANSSHLYGDLARMVDEEQPDVDFFVNITHVQVHRHAKALQRLRKALAGDPGTSEQCFLSVHSLSNVLLPIATHAIYQNTSKQDENLILESVATVGAICRYLTWSNYSTTLWTHIMQFSRYKGQEKYLIALICAIIDSFHFAVDEEGSTNSAVFRALESRFIPKIKSLMTKEKPDKNGTKVKVLRPSVVLALLKLLNKFPAQYFASKLPHLLLVTCNGLASKDPSARDVARVTIARMVLEMDLSYLPDVLRELAITLNEGYKLHVLSATIQTILLELSKAYKPTDAKDASLAPFDTAVPAFMDLLQEDIFGVAQERKDAEGSHVPHVKEAVGSKAQHSLELIASMIQFRPSISAGSSVGSGVISSIHSLTIPFLERLRRPDLSNKSVRRIKECLSRVATGLLRNPSLNSEEFFPFVQSTLESFVCRDDVKAFVATIQDDLDSDNENPVRPIKVSGSGKRSATPDKTTKVNVEVAEWRPSTLKAPTTSKAARSLKDVEEWKTAQVLDGASAPKLTGSARYLLSGVSGVHTKSLNDPAVISAVNFTLQLLTSVLKKLSTFPATDETLDKFVILLTTCVCRCRDSGVMLLAMRCLCSLLKKDIPSLRQCSKSLATKCLELLTSSGTNQEIMQWTYKVLTFLINAGESEQMKLLTQNSNLSIEQRENALAMDVSLPLDSEKMQVLVSFLQESVLDTSQHSQAIGLVRAIMSHQYVSVEFYDLMETVLEQTVRNSSSSAREQFSKSFFHYFINYPLSEDRINQHLKQIVLNISYEYSEGRLSTIRLLNLLFDKLPETMIRERWQTFYLPLSLQLVNDESNDCREAVATCIGKLLRNLSTENLQSLFDFTERWAKGHSDLCRMALQLFSIFVEVRLDFLNRSSYVNSLVEMIIHSMQTASERWEVTYFALVLVEKLTEEFSLQITQNTTLWQSIVGTMVNSHSWIQLVSSRLICKSLSSLDPKMFTETDPGHFLVTYKGSLYEIARNVCFQIGSDESEQNDDLTTLNVKALSWIIQAMNNYPHLCFSSDGSIESRDPVRWVMNRLSNIAKLKGSKRREAVYKCFAAFASLCGNFVFDYLELMLEPLHRSETEAKNIFDPVSAAVNAKSPSGDITDDAQLAKSVMHLLEEKCDDHHRFLQAYAKVKTDARDKKERRKNEIKVEAVTDPVAAAQRRIHKQETARKRRKKRVDECRNMRGGTAKRRHIE